MIIVSTSDIWWILWFSVRYAAAAACREIFGINALRGKLQQLALPNLQDIFIGGREIFSVNALRGKLHQLLLPNLQDIFIGGKLLWD